MDKPIDKERAEGALNFLIGSDEQFADFQVEVDRSDLAMKRTKDALFHTGSGGVEARKAKANLAEEAIAAEERWLDAKQDYLTLKNRRGSATLLWEHWRSLLSARKQGTIV